MKMLDFGIVIIVAGAFLFVGLFAVGYAVLQSRLGLRGRLEDAEDKPQKPGFKWLSYLSGSEKVFRPLGEMLPRSPEEMSRQERRLAQAGIRRRDAPAIFYGVKIALAVSALVAFVVTGYWKTNPLLYSALPILVGAMLPDLWLSRVIMNRQDRIRLGLPDAMDLSVVCVEAGLGLDQSLMRIGQELHPSHPDLSDELHLYGLEVNAGKRRADALRNLGSRTEVEDLKSLVAVLIQTDRFGTSIAQSLRVFAETMRTKRRQRAEERAAKMAVKMIPALALFFVPAILIVVLGPGLIAISKYLLPGLSGQK
jgi:tight adherence protein C